LLAVELLGYETEKGEGGHVARICHVSQTR
jgi:hypothetical protein